MVPFVIITGFLGCGKTTLLNRLLAMRQAEGTQTKLGLIVNELGEVGVDGELLPQGASRQIELPGGCVCCVLSDDLGTTILDMLRANPELDAIVLETTGVAEPLPLAWALERPPVADAVRLATVITLVDTLAFRSSLPLSPAVATQVAYGDVLLLTKGELADAAARADTEDAVRALAPRALVRADTTEAHAAWLHAILADPGLESLPALEPGRGAHRGCEAGDAHGHRHDHDPSADHAGAPGEHLLGSVAAMLPDRVVDLEELEDRLAALPASYVRIKGLVRAVDGRRPGTEVAWYAFHRVGLRVSSEPLGRPSSARVVALGRDLDLAAVTACVEQAVVAP
ncbi:MAG: GTP-binding protein [Kofleriaceae bacterium]